MLRLKSLEAVMSKLDYHAGNQAVNREESTPSFVGMLRPYKGLQPVVFHEVVVILKEIAAVLRGADDLPRPLVASLWAICWYPRYWALSADSMLRRNNLISKEDLSQLTEWVDQITHTVGQLLDGVAESEAFEAP
jgi:hypothetical protein